MWHTQYIHDTCLELPPRPKENFRALSDALVLTKHPAQVSCAGHFDKAFAHGLRHTMMHVRRPDRLPLAAAEYVAEVLGAKYAEPPAADMSEALAEEPSTAPLLLLLSPGGNPGAALARLAAEHGSSERLSTLTLGQGQVRCSLAFSHTCFCV